MNNNRLVAWIGLILVLGSVSILRRPEFAEVAGNMLVCFVVGAALLCGGLLNEVTGGGE